MGKWDESERLRTQLLEEAPHVFDIWMERDETLLIYKKYALTEWQKRAYNWDVLYDAFLKDASLITFPNRIKYNLSLTDQTYFPQF